MLSCDSSCLICTEISLPQPLTIFGLLSKDSSLGFRFHIEFVEVAGVEQKLF